MTSEKKIESNRDNAKKSTGPKSLIGKQRASQNAVKHGLLSKGLIIPGEKASAYGEFRNGIFDSLKPKGTMESLLADKIVNFSWRLRRAVLAESLLLHGNPNGQWESKTLDSLFIGIEGKKLQNISRYETIIERHFYRSLKEFRELQKLRLDKEKREEDPFGFALD